MNDKELEREILALETIPRDSKHKSDSQTFKLYAKRFYQEIKQEQNQVLQSSFNTLNPNTKIFL